MDTPLYDLSIPLISSLQTKFTDHANLMQLISVVLDPKYAFLIYSPIAYLVNRQVGNRLIMTTVIAEWLNMCLKWLLHGERPYWYVHSSGSHDPKLTPIQQFPVTCELGPGHPSGHAMVTAAVWYVILDSLLDFYNSHLKASAPAPQQATTTTTTTTQRANHLPPASPRQVSVSVWFLYAALIITVSVSRVFLGCHFPHQCMAGALLGLLVAKTVCRYETQAIHFIVASVFMMASALSTFALLRSLGFDPAWTIELAMKHCVKREYIHLDTAPFFSLMRYCGFALGSGLGLMLPLKSYINQVILNHHASTTTTASQEEEQQQQQVLADAEADKKSKHPLSSRNLSWFSIKILIALLLARLVDNLGLFVSHTNLTLFYSSAFLGYTLFSYAFVNL